MQSSYRIVGAKLDAIVKITDQVVTQADSLTWMIGQSLAGVKSWANRRGASMTEIVTETPLEDQLLLAFGSAAGAIIGAEAIKSVRQRSKKKVFRISTAEETSALITSAIKDGRYSEQWETVCPLCGLWIPCYYGQSVQTGIYMCKQCFIDQGGELPNQSKPEVLPI